MSPDNEFDTPPLQRFPATPYKAEGGFSVPGLFVTLAICVAAGIVAGLIAAIVGQWFYLILLFPLAMGVIVGIASGYGAHLGKLRSVPLGFVFGALGGIIATLCAHYFEFWFALGKLDQRVPGITELRYSPGAFLTYIDESAKIGVQWKGSRDEKTTKLGYSGSYIYWSFDLLIVMGISSFCTAGVTTTPFCSRCNNWKKERALGQLNVTREVLLEVLQSGELERLAGDGSIPNKPRFSLGLSVCPHCKEKSTIDIKFNPTIHEIKKNEEAENVIHVTYPGEALEVFVKLTDPKPQQDWTGKPAPAPVGRDWSELFQTRGYWLDPVNIRFDDEAWKLIFTDKDAILFDFEKQVVAVIPYSEASERVKLPSFWASITHLGIETDNHGIVWFQNDKEKTAKIRKRFGL